jgi:hypothetical protein
MFAYTPYSPEKHPSASCFVVVRARMCSSLHGTLDDTFQCGQWLKGRVYERRCDPSPNGELLLYFAANYGKPYRSWSAISRPPFLTALALWPKGDGWGGGGHFLSENRIELNHRTSEMELASGFSIPKSLRVRPFGKRPGWGED